MMGLWCAIRPTRHFEQQIARRRINRSAVLACVIRAAPRLLAYEGCRLALDCGALGIPVVLVEFGHVFVLTVLAPGQYVIRPDTLRVRAERSGRGGGDRLRRRRASSTLEDECTNRL